MIKKNFLNASHSYRGPQKNYNAKFNQDGEIQMFRRLADGIAAKCNAILTPEMHGKGYVKFQTSFGVNRIVEISDLLVICKKKKHVKISFLQAKKHHSLNQIGTPFVLDFQADLLQYDLLSNAPNIVPTRRKFPFPKNILNFSTTGSLRTYGVFYIDANGDTNMLYSATSQLYPLSSLPQKIAPKAHPQIQLAYFNKKSSLMKAEMINNDCVGAKDVNTYAKELMKFNIGAELILSNPSVVPVAKYIITLLNNRLVDVNMKLNSNSNHIDKNRYYLEKTIISEILYDCFGQSEVENEGPVELLTPYGGYGGYPRMLIVDCTDYEENNQNDSEK